VCEEEMEFEFTPARPAPCCSNHDDPRFSDPGNGAEIEGPEECENCGHEIDQEKVLDKAQDHFS
jgi:hypothetical protein